MSGKITFRNSYLESINGIDYLNLREKNHYETGFAAGTLFLKSDYKIIKLFKNPLVRIILWILQHKYKSKIREVRIPKEYQDELRGCAEAVKIPYRYLLLINLIYEIRGCSGFVFFNPDGSLLLGHTTDVSKFLAKLALRYVKPLVVNTSIPDKNNFIHVAFPIMLGVLNGFNNKGLAVSSHDAGGVYTKVVKNNISTSCFIKMVLENAKNSADIRQIAQDNLVYYPVILMVASEQEHKASILEAYPSDFDFTSERDSAVFSTNHYQSSKMRKYHRVVKKGSLDRLTCLKDILSERTNLSVQEAIEALKDHRNGIQRDTTGYSIANSGTFQSFVFDVTKGDIYISNGGKLPVPLYGNFVKISTSV